MPSHRRAWQAALEARSYGNLSKSVTVVIVSGRGRAFCAGNDIAEIRHSSRPGKGAVPRWQRS